MPKKPQQKKKRVGKRRAVRMASAPSAMAAEFRNIGPRASVVHRRSELVAKITATTDTYSNVLDLYINPGLPATFPWLSQIAQNYEMYRFRKLRFRYEPASATAIGGFVSVIPATDALENPPSTLQAAYSFEGTVQGAVWKDHICDFNLRQGNNMAGVSRYVRSGFTQGDLKTYDVGRLWVSLDGIPPGSGTVGALIVEYDVELYDPVSAAIQRATTIPNLFFSNGVNAALVPDVVATASAKYRATRNFFQTVWNTGQLFATVDNTLTDGVNTYTGILLQKGTYLVKMHGLAFSSVGTSPARGNLELHVHLADVGVLNAGGGIIPTAPIIFEEDFSTETAIPSDYHTIDVSFFVVAPNENPSSNILVVDASSTTAFGLQSVRLGDGAESSQWFSIEPFSPNLLSSA
jgi:hypothetical protein